VWTVVRIDPATSVLDPWCRSHDIENLWVIDALLPLVSGDEPALTIAAQALRVAASPTWPPDLITAARLEGRGRGR